MMTSHTRTNRVNPAGCVMFFITLGLESVSTFAAGGEKIASTSIQGFWVKRAWLDPDKTPKVGACLKEIMRGMKRG